MSAAGDWLVIRKALVRARTARGIAQRAIARHLEVTRQALSAWETGVNFPPADKLFAWAAFVGVRIVLDQTPTEIEAAIANCANQPAEIAA